MNVTFTTELSPTILVIICPYCRQINTRPNDDKAWEECDHCNLTYKEAMEAS